MLTNANLNLRVVTYESLKANEKTGWYFPRMVAVAYGRERLLTRDFYY